jgi:hypothetical protein
VFRCGFVAVSALSGDAGGATLAGWRPLTPLATRRILWQTVRVTDRQLTETRAETAQRFGLLLSSRAC